MKRANRSRYSLVALAAFLTLTAVSCKKDDDDDAGTLPQISFVSGTGYTAKDTTVSKGTTLKIGIAAAKTETNDVLTKFNESVAYDGGTATSVLNTTLSGTQGDAYTTDVNVTARNQAGKEKYTFTIVNKDGLTNSVSLTLTVQ